VRRGAALLSLAGWPDESSCLGGIAALQSAPYPFAWTLHGLTSRRRCGDELRLCVTASHGGGIMAKSARKGTERLDAAVAQIQKALAAKTAGGRGGPATSLAAASQDLLSRINREIGVSIRGRAAAVTTVTIVTTVTLFDDDEDIVVAHW
jgi:hypothetical protein